MINKRKLFAHRGYYNNINIPENSLKAFQKAIDYNLNIELDIQILKDNTIIVFHDYNLKRMTGINKRVKDCVYNDIKDLTLLNTNQKIPLLKDILKIVPEEIEIIIDIKNEQLKFNLEKVIIEFIKNLKNTTYLCTFNLLTILYLNKKQKKTKLIKSGIIIINNNKIKKIINQLLTFITNKKIIKIDFISCNKEGISYLKINKKNLLILSWTITNKEEYIKLKDKVDFFIINCNEFFKNGVQNRN